MSSYGAFENSDTGFDESGPVSTVPFQYPDDEPACCGAAPEDALREARLEGIGWVIAALLEEHKGPDDIYRRLLVLAREFAVAGERETIADLAEKLGMARSTISEFRRHFLENIEQKRKN